MDYRFATLRDVDLLTEMNQQLVEDEGHRHRFKPLPWLRSRMESLLERGYRAVVFEVDGRPVAYALFVEESDDTIFLRQFFVRRDMRRRGIGRKAMQVLKEEVWPRDKRLTVEVLSGNKAGYAFWKAMGYKDYSVELEIPPSER